MVLFRCLLLAHERRSGVGMLMHCLQIATKFTKISLTSPRQRRRWHFGWISLLSVARKMQTTAIQVGSRHHAKCPIHWRSAVRQYQKGYKPPDAVSGTKHSKRRKRRQAMPRALQPEVLYQPRNRIRLSRETAPVPGPAPGFRTSVLYQRGDICSLMAHVALRHVIDSQ